MQKKNSYDIYRIINNNVITSKDKDGNEIVLMGKGIAYLKKVGDMVETDTVEKVFVLKEKETNRYLEIIETIPAQYFETALEILEFAEHQLQVKSSPIAYVMLADHISSAVERCQQGILVKNEMLGEIKNFFRKEYDVGKSALMLIKDEIGVELPIDEAGFIAYHIINLSNGMKNDEGTGLIKKVIEVIEGYFNVQMDKESIYYERFLTHLKYFNSRVFTAAKDKSEKEGDDFLYRMLRIQYPEVAKCVELIQEYVNFGFKITISDEEKGYLMVHINTLLSKSKVVTVKGQT